MRAEIVERERERKKRTDKIRQRGLDEYLIPAQVDERCVKSRDSAGGGAWCAKLRLLLLGISLYSFHLKSLSLSLFPSLAIRVCVYLSPHSYCPSNLSVGGLGRNRQWTGLHDPPLSLCMLFGVSCMYYHALHTSLSSYTLMLLAAPHALDSPPYIYPNLAYAPACFYRKKKESTKLFGYIFFFCPCPSALFSSSKGSTGYVVVVVVVVAAENIIQSASAGIIYILHIHSDLDGMKHSCNTLHTQRSSAYTPTNHQIDVTWIVTEFFSGSHEENWGLFRFCNKMRIISLFRLKLPKIGHRQFFHLFGVVLINRSMRYNI